MELLENISLRPFNTFGIEARAAWLARFADLETLRMALDFARRQNLPLLVLGGGSNILFTKDVAGLVLKNELKGIRLLREDEEHYYVEAAAGENWHGFVQHCINNGYAGLENLSLIPGLVGASPMQNIGAYGVEIRDVFDSLEALHVEDGSLVRFSREECAFGYRESVFKRKFRNQFIILSVRFRLNKRPVFNTTYGAIEQELEAMGVKELSIKAISEAVIRIRSSKLPNPAEMGNAGSFFKNPEVPEDTWQRIKAQHPGVVAFPLANGRVKLAAGWLIEQCGWKGFREGDAGCHARQALVLVNYGNARGEDIFQLSEKIIESVRRKFGVELEREVNIF